MRNKVIISIFFVKVGWAAYKDTHIRKFRRQYLIHITILNYSISDYASLLSTLSKDWLSLERHHRVSKRASNAFWELSTRLFPLLIEARQRENIATKISQFRSIRKKLYKPLPRIILEVAYQVKSTGDIIILQDLDSIPVKKFPPCKFRKLYESAKVSVSSVGIFNYKHFFGTFQQTLKKHSSIYYFYIFVTGC